MDTGKNYNKESVLQQIKVGHYIKWKPIADEDIISQYSEYGFKSFVGFGEDWQYGLVLDIMQSPKNKDNPDSVQGLHLRLLKGDQTDWIFNFEYFREIEIVGFLDEEYEKHNT
tara:strand:+ start:324 stop:662 length:339 start_codon:yes stop_codon:yes gene_type:complete